MVWTIVIAVSFLLVAAVALYDLLQTSDPILRNFPVVGHGRHLLQELGPKLRQYIIADNNEERPFSRDQRNWVYWSAEKKNNYFGFGTDNDLERSPSYLIVKQAAFPIIAKENVAPNADKPLHPIPSAKVMGGPRNRAKAFRPESILNVSAMSYGSLSAAAVEAINRGCAIAGCLQNTGEGGVAQHHKHGGQLIWQLGTGYFGARNDAGRFDEKQFVDVCDRFAVKAVEVKLSQGAKPGKGGILPAGKITAEISQIRGIPQGKDCVSPAGHYEFSNADELLDFVERLADLSGLPIGIKSAVGEMSFWTDLIGLMQDNQRGVDYIAIDGGEGGTGAAPLTFSDHVSLPFKMGFSRVYRLFAEAGLHERVVFIGSGKLGYPEEALLAMAMGCDMINVGREAMLAIGCIQAQLCHTGKCPTGVATQNKWLMRGLDPTDKGAKLANYLVTLRKEILDLTHACGQHHPAMLTPASFEILHDGFESRPVADVFHLQGLTTTPGENDLREIELIMRAKIGH